MNLLCPNCQKPLTVPEQYAGQPMRCPLCSGTFTVPALPTPAAPVSLRRRASADASVAPPLRPIPMGSRIPSRRRLSPFRRRTPPNWPLSKRRLRRRAPSGVGGGAPAAPRQAFTEAQPTFPSTPTPEGYQKKYTIWFSPKYLQYVAPVALFLVFILTFFSWVGVYPGGVADATQNMWQAAFGGFSIEPDVKFVVDPFPKYADKNGEKSSEPNWDVLLIFYFVVLIPTLVIALGMCGVAVPAVAKAAARPRIRSCRGAGVSWPRWTSSSSCSSSCKWCWVLAWSTTVLLQRIVKSPPARRRKRMSPRPRRRGGTPSIGVLNGKSCGDRLARFGCNPSSAGARRRRLDVLAQPPRRTPGAAH